MENVDRSEENQRRTEWFVLVLYSIYSVCMFFISLEMYWESWVSFFMLAAPAVSWGIHLGKYRSYRFRAVFTACMMQVTMLLYAMYMEELLPVLALFAAFVIFMGLYGIPEVLYITVGSTLFLLFYHGILLGKIGEMTLEMTLRVMMHVCNIFLIEFVVYSWVRTRNESNGQYRRVIRTLKDAEQSKDDFLANVSHEIRTPINTIYGMSEVVLRENDPAKIREQVMDIQMAGRTLMSVVGDILDFSELQSGKVDLEEEAYNITSTINDVINMAMAKKSGKKIELIVDCDGDIPSTLLGDEKKIRRVILNLVDNAIKFTGEGYVSIAVGCRREEYGINLCVTVKDTGIGINAENQEKLFSRFNQVDSKRNRQEGGIGLGLAISQALVYRMDGTITVKSRPGKGSEFRLVVPQKVIDEQPIIHVEQREGLNIAVYIDMEQFDMLAIRDEYRDNLDRMVKRLNVQCHVCRNLPELKRRMENEYFTHIFITLAAYEEDRTYFDHLSRQTKVVTVIDKQDEKLISNTDILRIYKPFYILPVAGILNGEEEVDSLEYLAHRYKFTAPDAHVLVVDDNVMNLNVIESLLDRYKIQVTTVTSGKAALEKIETQEYDFVFMDHMMPEMDGIETLHRIREKVGAYYRTVPVIVLTANAIAGTREMFLKEGFADFMEKPVEISVLERMLVRNIPKEKLIPCEEKQEEQHAETVQEQPIPTAQEQPRQTSEEKLTAFEEDVEAAEEGALVIGDFDVETGILYCGGMESYIKILQRYLETGEENREMVDELYREENWKDYTIAVHGVKSSMRSVGASHLSDVAKELEMAGKEGDIDYIREHHGELLKEYGEFLHVLDTHPLIHPQAEEAAAETSSLPELSEEDFDAFEAEMEEAMYSLDGDAMQSIVEKLQGYRYCGKELRSVLASVRRKTEMADYMSAAETLTKLRARLKNGSVGGEKA